MHLLIHHRRRWHTCRDDTVRGELVLDHRELFFRVFKLTFEAVNDSRAAIDRIFDTNSCLPSEAVHGKFSLQWVKIVDKCSHMACTEYLVDRFVVFLFGRGEVRRKHTIFCAFSPQLLACRAWCRYFVHLMKRHNL